MKRNSTVRTPSASSPATKLASNVPSKEPTPVSAAYRRSAEPKKNQRRQSRNQACQTKVRPPPGSQPSRDRQGALHHTKSSKCQNRRQNWTRSLHPRSQLPQSHRHASENLPLFQQSPSISSCQRARTDAKS